MFDGQVITGLLIPAIEQESRMGKWSFVPAVTGFWLGILFLLLLDEFLQEYLPKTVMEIPEATYLAWLDLSAYFEPDDDLPCFFAYKAGVLLEGGDALFVGNANRFIRLNLAMPRMTLQLGLERIRDAILNEKVK